MLVENQKVIMKWNGRNKKHFIAKGYCFTKIKDEFEVSVGDLTKGSAIPIKVICDFCDTEKEVLFNQYYEQVIKPKSNKYCCKECVGKRVSENHSKQLKGFKNHKNCGSLLLQGIVYEFTEKINELDDLQRKLINEIQRFCEENKKFPSEKDLTNKKGYVSRTLFYKHFNTNTFTDIYNYIYPLQKETRNTDITKIQKEVNKPIYHICSKCKIEKEFTLENFPEGKTNKFGLRTVCRNCDNRYSYLLTYKNKGIIFEKTTDIAPEQWWVYLYENKIGYLPDFCLEKVNIIKIVRFALLGYLKKTRSEIVKLKITDYKDIHVYHLYYGRFKDQYDFLNKCFPEFNYRKTELTISKNVSDEDIINLIDKFITDNKLTTEKILDNEFDTKSNKKLNSIVNYTFKSFNDLFVWYFEKKDIKINGLKINAFHFKVKSNNFWTEMSNRVTVINQYCSENGIDGIIDDNKKLKKWIFKFFKQNNINKLLSYGLYCNSLYDLLIETYPEIKENKVLFDWEWHQWNDYSKETMIRILREMVYYRMNLLDIKYDLPKTLRYSSLSKTYPKLNKALLKCDYFKNYYEWAIAAFPEFSDFWLLKDFNLHQSDDGTIFDSSHEKTIYELLKSYNINIKAVGIQINGEYKFNINETNWYVPDFVIEDTLDKPIIIEYFGMYNEKYVNNKLLNNYRNKTNKKIEYYSQLDNIYFVSLFPNDLDYNFKGLKNKLTKYGFNFNHIQVI